MATNQSILRKLMGANTDDKSIRSQAIWKLVSNKEEDEQIELLSICFTERDKVPKNEEDLKNEGLSNETWQMLSESLSEMVSAHLKNAFFNSRNVNQFSKHVLKLINFYEDENEKVYCLSRCIYSVYVPFLELPGTPLRMTDEKFTHLLKTYDKKVDLIKYLVKLPFNSYTEAISHVLHIIDSEKNQEVRTALLAYYFIARQKLIQATYEEK